MTVNFQMSWRTIAIVSACLNLSLIVVVAVISASGSVDYLSTLALALAIIAFVVQIIVFIAQAGASGAQLARSEELHGSTMRALATIEEKAEGTRRTVTSMSDQMLAAVIAKFSPPGGLDGEQGRGMSVTSEVIASLEEERREAAETVSGPRPAPASKAAELVPPRDKERVKAAASAAAQLSDLALLSLEWLGNDYRRFGGAAEGTLGHGVESTGVEPELYELGLAKRIRASWGSRPTVTVLTGLGKDVAALVLGPEYVGMPSEILAARGKITEMNRGFMERQEAEAERLERFPVEE